MTISTRTPDVFQPIDRNNYNTTCSFLKYLGPIDLVRFSRTRTKWYNYVVDYSLEVIKMRFPHLYKVEMTGQQALACLVRPELPCYILDRGRFAHIEIDISSLAEPRGVVHGLCGGYLIHTKPLNIHPAQSTLLSSETGEVKGHISHRNLLEWYAENCLWTQIGKILHAWELPSGKHRHQFNIDDPVLDVKSHQGHVIILTRVGEKTSLSVLPAQSKTLKRLQAPGEEFSVVTKRGINPDFCLNGSTLSVIYYNSNDKHILASYSLDEKLDLILPHSQREFLVSVRNTLAKRYEFQGLDLLCGENFLWKIVDRVGKSIREEIYNLTYTDKHIVFLIKKNQQASLIVFDPLLNTLRVAWTLSEDKLPPFFYLNTLLLPTGGPNVLFFIGTQVILINIKTLQTKMLYSFEIPGSNFAVGRMFDGEKVFCVFDKKVHIFDFRVTEPTPLKQVTLSDSAGLQIAELPQLGLDLKWSQPQALPPQPHPIQQPQGYLRTAISSAVATVTHFWRRPR